MTRARDILLSREQIELKKASKGLVRAVGGTDGAAASLSTEQRSVRQQRVSDCTLPNTADFLRIDEAAELEDLSHGQPGWPHVTRALAKRQGFVLLPLPEAVGDSNLHRLLGEITRDTSEVVQRTLDALADGQLTADEIRDKDIAGEIREAISAFARLLGVVDAILPEDRGR